MNYFKQSPINIETTLEIEHNCSIEFNYQNEFFLVSDTSLNISLVPKSCKSHITFEGKQYKLTELHFHRPSEHHVNGGHFDMEMHMVHQTEIDTIVFSTLLRQAPNGDDFNRPFSNIGKIISLDLSKFIPKKKLWNYYGSFTTTPFAENVIWFINQEPYPIDANEGNALSNHYPCNNRCLQPLNARKLFVIDM